MSQTPSSPPPPPSPPPLRVLPMDAQPAAPFPPYPPPPPPMRVARPGVITAIGVISIVVASLGILAGLFGVLGLLAFSFQARFAGMRPPAALVAPVATPGGPTTAPSAAPANPALPVSPRGLDAAGRVQVAEGLAELRFLSGPRLEQLDVLLARAGQDMFPAPDATPRTAEAVEEMVLGHASGLSANPGVAGPDTFRTRGGRFELYDDRAVFYPNDGEIVRATTLTSTRAGLTPEQVEKVIRQAQAAGGGMNPSQLAALRTLLATPGQQHVSPIRVPTAVRDVQPGADGAVDITFPNGWASIGPQGQVVSSLATGGGMGLPGGAPIRANGAAMAVALFTTVVGMGLALYLLVCGVLVLRESPRGRRLHLIYAAFKIPVAIASALAVWWLTSDFIEAAQRTANASASYVASSAGDMADRHFWMAALGLVYPLALLIALQMRVVKDYYRSGVIE